jgi:mannose-1-phosphate guanylyltransferase
MGMTGKPKDTREGFSTGNSGDLWSIVLSGGDGKRLSPLIQRWLGYHRPKQYCTFVGTRSLLQHTIDRTTLLTPSKRIFVIVDRSHRQIASAQLRNRPVKLLMQPCNRDTAAGIFLPLTYVRAMNPQATVAIFPSDHFVYPEDQFTRSIRRAVEEIQSLPDHVILMGVTPTDPEIDYGWIRLGETAKGHGGQVCLIREFVEKPVLQEAQAIYNSGALWNTGIIVAKADRLWQLGRQYLPEMMPLFENLASEMGTPREAAVLQSIYSVMPKRNFSSDLLQRTPKHIAEMTLEDVLWSDWGRPERIVQSLGAIYKQPAFSLECNRELLPAT